MQVIPGSSCSVVEEAKDLKPLRVRLLRYNEGSTKVDCQAERPGGRRRPTTDGPDQVSPTSRKRTSGRAGGCSGMARSLPSERLPVDDPNFDPAVPPSGRAAWNAWRPRRLVVPPAPLREMRPRRLLRLLANQHASKHAHADRPSCRAELRARRGLVLGLLRRRLRRRRAGADAAALAPGESVVPGPADRVPPDWQYRLN